MKGTFQPKLAMANVYLLKSGLSQNRQEMNLQCPKLLTVTDRSAIVSRHISRFNSQEHLEP